MDMDEDETGESALAAVGCVQAIRSVLNSVRNDKPLLKSL